MIETDFKSSRSMLSFELRLIICLATLSFCSGSAASAQSMPTVPAPSSRSGDFSSVSGEPVSVLSTEVLRRYVEGIARRHGYTPPGASVITRDELGKYFLRMMQQLALLPPEDFSTEDYKEIGLLYQEFDDTVQVVRGKLAMMAMRERPEFQGFSSKLSDQENRLAALEKVRISGDFTYAPQSDFGKTVRNSTAANLRGRLNFTAKVNESKDPSATMGDAYVFARLTGASGRFFPRNRYLLTPENGLVDGVASPFNSGLNEVQIPDLQVNNNNSNSVRPTISLEQVYYSQDVRVGSKLKGFYRVGLQNFSNTFDSNAFANNETTQFLNTSFVNNISWRTNFIGPSAVASVETPLFRKKAFLRATTGMISLASRDYFGGYGTNHELQFGHKFFQKEGNLRAGLWTFNFRKGADTPFITPTDLSPTGLISILPSSSGVRSDPSGFYLSADQRIWKNIGLWGRYALNDKQIGEVLLGGLLSSRQSWSCGVEIPVGSFFKKRPDDVIGIAYGQVSPYNRDGALTPATPAFVGINGMRAFTLSQVNSNLLATMPGAMRSADEKVIEAYYKYQVNKNISVSPDVQYYWNPGGVRPQPGIFVLGSRLNVTF